MSPPSVLARAPAKINLALHVGPVRGDGYHELATVYEAIDVYDEVRATPRNDPAVSVETVDPAGWPVVGVGADADHLAVRAAAALRRQCGVETGVHLHVRKDIPVAAGLAGGSADAAAALVACAALWGLGLDRPELLDVAAGLGSDVPFALVGGTAVGTGRGERVQPLPAAPATTWVLVTSTPGLSTPAVYARTDSMRAGHDLPAAGFDGETPAGDVLLADLLAAVRSGDADRIATGLHNDLQPAATRLRPGLAGVLAAGRAAGALAGLVSGSGPSLLLLVRGDAHAAAVATAVTSAATGALAGVRVRTVHGTGTGAAVVDDPPARLGGG